MHRHEFLAWSCAGTDMATWLEVSFGGLTWHTLPVAPFGTPFDMATWLEVSCGGLTWHTLPVAPFGTPPLHRP